MASGTRPFLDFKAIRERVPFLDVLARYRVEVRKVNHSQFKARCPLPSHSNGKEEATFYVNTDKNVFCCHSDSCKKAGNGASGNVLDFVRLMEGVQAYEAAAKLNEWYPDGLSKSLMPPENASNGVARGAAVGLSDSLINHPLAFTLKDVNPRHEMIQDRGISPETAAKYGVGFFPGKGSMAGRIVFELRENAAVIGYAGRAVAPDLEPKWLLPRGLVKSFVYGLEFCDPHRPLILTESFWAPLYYAERGMACAALMGVEMTEAQEVALAPFKIIWLAFDNDERGREATERIASRLRKNHSVKVLRLME